MTARCHVDDGKLVWNLLFCECDNDPTRKSRERMIVQLEAHSRASSKISAITTAPRIIDRAKKSVQRKMLVRTSPGCRARGQIENTGTAKSFGLKQGRIIV